MSKVIQMSLDLVGAKQILYVNKKITSHFNLDEFKKMQFCMETNKTIDLKGLSYEFYRQL
jgi:hypothetical protein